MENQGIAKGDIFVLPTNARWTQNKLSTMLEANTPEAFDLAFDAFLAANAQVTVNGAQATRAEYKQQLRDAGALGHLAASAVIRFKAEVEQQEEGEGERSGFVGVFCEVTVSEKVRVFGVPAQYKIIFSINVVIKQDHSLSVKDLDIRRAFVVNQVMTQKTVPVHPPIPVKQPADA